MCMVLATVVVLSAVAACAHTYSACAWVVSESETVSGDLTTCFVLLLCRMTIWLFATPPGLQASSMLSSSAGCVLAAPSLTAPGGATWWRPTCWRHWTMARQGAAVDTVAYQHAITLPVALNLALGPGLLLLIVLAVAPDAFQPPRSAFPPFSSPPKHHISPHPPCLLMLMLMLMQLDAALLDVTDPEPLPPSSRLWTHPRVRLTPHVASMTSREVRVRVCACV